MKSKNYVFRVLALGLFVYWGITSITLDMSINHVFAQDQVTQDMIEHLEQMLEATGSYRANLKSIFEDGKEIKGKFKFKWPNMRWQENRFPRKHGGFHTAYIISNGTIRWNYMPSLNWALKYNEEALNEDARLKGWLSAAYLEEASLLYIGKEDLHGEEVHVIEGESSALYRHENPDPLGKIRFYVGVKDGILRKVITYNPQGQEAGSETYTNIQLDDSISAKDFEFSPPDGTKVSEVNAVGSRTNPNP